MAQNDDNNNNNNNNVNIPDQISWTNNSKEKIYRGTTSVQPSLQSQDFAFGAKAFGKNASRSEAISFPSEISGGAIDLNFASIQPAGHNKTKPSAPTITLDVLPSIQQQSTQQQQPSINQHHEAPPYDGFQPHYAHHSNSLDPIKMKQTLDSLFNELTESGLIDFYEKSPFIYAGRAYGKYNDCEFLLSIFTHHSSECIIELRRSSGESFQFANIENNILDSLKQSGAITNDKDEDEVDDDDDDGDDMDEDDQKFGFGFGFESLPSLDSMELDSNFSTTDNDDEYDDDQKQQQYPLQPNSSLTINDATQILQDAVDLDAMRDVLRADIAHLNEQMAKHEDVFKQIPDIISIIIGVINDQLFDCWAIKSYLGMISKLISCKATIPSNLSKSIENIKTRWCHMVINEVAPGVQFEFYPSQQIVKVCNQITEQLQ